MAGHSTPSSVFPLKDSVVGRLLLVYLYLSHLLCLLSYFSYSQTDSETAMSMRINKIRGGIAFN